MTVATRQRLDRVLNSITALVLPFSDYQAPSREAQAHRGVARCNVLTTEALQTFTNYTISFPFFILLRLILALGATS